MALFLRENTFFVTNDGHTVHLYNRERIGSEFGSWSARIGGIPGRQIFGVIGGEYLGSVEDWYHNMRSFWKTSNGLNILREATEDEIAAFHAFEDVELPVEAIQQYLQYFSFNQWLQSHLTENAGDNEHFGYDLVRQYLHEWTDCPAALMCESWGGHGHPRYTGIVGLEFVGQRYLRLPGQFRVLQRLDSLDMSVAQMWEIVEDRGEQRRWVWQSGERDIFN